MKDYDIEVRKHEDQGVLVIVDSMHGYQLDVMGVYKLPHCCQSGQKRMAKEAFSTSPTWAHSFLWKRKEELVNYELLLPQWFDVPLK